MIGICLSKGNTEAKDSTKKNHHNDVRKQGKPRLNTLGKQSYQDVDVEMGFIKYPDAHAKKHGIDKSYSCDIRRPWHGHMENVTLNDLAQRHQENDSQANSRCSRKKPSHLLQRTHSSTDSSKRKKGGNTPLVTRRAASGSFVIGPWQSRPEFSRPILRAQCPRSLYRGPLSIRQKRRGPDFPRFLLLLF